MRPNLFLFLVILIAFATVYELREAAADIPRYMALSMVRMTGAYLLSLAFSLSIGLLVAHNEKAFRLIFPVLDILQSVPILGFLPFAVLFIIHAIPVIGSEISTMFLIFTSMTWAIVFNVIEGARSIPPELKDVARMNGVSGPAYLVHVLLPAIYGPLVSGSIAAWGGGWYFLFAGEFVTFGKEPPYILEGIGSFIARSAYAGSIAHSLVGMAILAAMVLFMNNFVWRPLLGRAPRFGYSQSGEYRPSGGNVFIRTLEKGYAVFKARLLGFIPVQTTWIMDRLGIHPARSVQEKRGFSFYDVAIVSFVVLAFAALFLLSRRPLEEIPMMIGFTAATLLRIAVAYTIAVVWTTAAAIYLSRHPKAMERLMPLFDVAQSIPAIAVFPILVVFVIQRLGGGIGLELASILLLLTGMQWYLLFNLVRAVQNVPADLLDAARMLGMNLHGQVRHVILPAILPTMIVGSMQAIGGGWNATIISEYIVYKDQVFHADGLGYLLTAAATRGDTIGVLLSVLVMMMVIIFLNKFIWRTALKKVEAYKV